MHVTFRKNKVIREVKVGFSWTVLFFGAFPFACRGMWGWFWLTVLLCVCTYGLGGIVMAFFANKITARWLAENGWMVSSGQIPAGWGIAI